MRRSLLVAVVAAVAFFVGSSQAPGEAPPGDGSGQVTVCGHDATTCDKKKADEPAAKHDEQSSTSATAVTKTSQTANWVAKEFASGFNNPRGLTFGPDGYLYVAEGGLGGSNLPPADCPPVHGAAAPYKGSTDDPHRGGRISKVSPTGVVSTVVDALPSSQTSEALGSLVSGVSSVAFVGNQLYALLAGAGCSHGVPAVPNGVIKVNGDGSWKLIANLSAFQAAHPVAHPDDRDFEPDGTWYSMASYKGVLYPMDSNHGELDRVTPSGEISRVLDVSDKVGHVVPTALAHEGSVWYIGNLGVFGPEDGTVPNEHVFRLTPGGEFRSVASDLEQVVSLAFYHGRLYALELSATPGGPQPGMGAIVRVRPNGTLETIYSGLNFPTGMAIDRNGAFYVTENGFGAGEGAGTILRIARG
jgi:hypothetical protein